MSKRPKIEPATTQDVAERYIAQLGTSAEKLLKAIHDTAQAEHEMMTLRGQPGTDEARHVAAMKFRTVQSEMEKVILDHIRLDQQFIRHIEKMKEETP